MEKVDQPIVVPENQPAVSLLGKVSEAFLFTRRLFNQTAASLASKLALPGADTAKKAKKIAAAIPQVLSPFNSLYRVLDEVMAYESEKLGNRVELHFASQSFVSALARAEPSPDDFREGAQVLQTTLMPCMNKMWRWINTIQADPVANAEFQYYASLQHHSRTTLLRAFREELNSDEAQRALQSDNSYTRSIRSYLAFYPALARPDTSPEALFHMEYQQAFDLGYYMHRQLASAVKETGGARALENLSKRLDSKADQLLTSVNAELESFSIRHPQYVDKLEDFFYWPVEYHEHYVDEKGMLQSNLSRPLEIFGPDQNPIQQILWGAYRSHQAAAKAAGKAAMDWVTFGKNLAKAYGDKLPTDEKPPEEVLNDTYKRRLELRAALGLEEKDKKTEQRLRSFMLSALRSREQETPHK